MIIIRDDLANAVAGACIGVETKKEFGFGVTSFDDDDEDERGHREVHVFSNGKKQPDWGERLERELIGGK